MLLAVSLYVYWCLFDCSLNKRVSSSWDLKPTRESIIFLLFRRQVPTSKKREKGSALETSETQDFTQSWGGGAWKDQMASST